MSLPARSYRFSPQTLRQIDALRECFGGIDATSVLRIAVALTHQECLEGGCQKGMLLRIPGENGGVILISLRVIDIPPNQTIGELPADPDSIAEELEQMISRILAQRKREENSGVGEGVIP